MQINAALNLAFPIRWSDAGAPLVWAYHTPISTEVFQANYRVIAAAKAALFSKGVGYAADAGPRIASLALQDAARADALEQGTESVAKPLLAELKRLTMVLAPSESGYTSIPVDMAIARNVIDADDWVEGESAVAFFTCGYAMALRQRREATARALALVLTGSTTSLTPSEWAASLAPLTTAETSEVLESVGLDPVPQ